MGRWREWKPDGKSEVREGMDAQSREDFDSLSVGVSGTAQYKKNTKCVKQKKYILQLHIIIKYKKIEKGEKSNFKNRFI